MSSLVGYDDGEIDWVLESPMKRGNITTSHKMKKYYDVAKFQYLPKLYIIL
jgi:hypothetical protein